MLEHKCEICGRFWRKKLKADGKVVCNKHYKQFKKFGCFRDASPRTQRDKNDIHIDGNIVYIDLYDKAYNVIAHAIIDAEDIDKIKNIKWRLNGYGYVVNNSSTNMYLHRRVLGTEDFVDHINHNKLDNRKSNLRLITHSQNQMNAPHKGVYQKEMANHEIKWIAKIKFNQKQQHLGVFAYKEEAEYARWYAEQILFGEFAYPKEEPDIPEQRKAEIRELVKSKVQRL